MTLLLLAVILAVLVTACVYACWDASTFTRRTLRAIEVQQIRRDRAAEDAAWAAYRAEARERETVLGDLLLDQAALERLHELVDAYAPTTEDWPVVA